MSIFLIIFTILFAILSWKKINWAIILIAFALPTYLLRFQIGFMPMTVLETMILILFLVWLIKYAVLSRRTVYLSKYKWLIFLFLIAATIGVIVSPDKIAALGIWKAYFIEPILLFIVLINIFKNRKDFKKVFYAFGLSAILISLVAIYQKFTGAWIPNEFWQAEATRRVTSVFGYPNAIGLFLAPIVIWYLGDLVFKWKEKEWSLKIFNALVIVVSSLAIVWAKSEGAIVAMIVVAAIIFLKNKKIRKLAVPILILGLILIFALPSSRTILIEKLTLQDYSGQVRREMWSETWDMLTETPIEGAGLAGYQERVAIFHEKPHIEIYLYPHNIFLNFWSEIGLLGLVVWWLIIGKIFIDYKKIQNSKFRIQNSYLIYLMIILVILIHGLVDVPYFKNDLSVFWWILMANIVLERTNREDEKNLI